MRNNVAKHLQADWPLHMSFEKANSEVENFYSIVNGTITDANSIFHKKTQVNIFLLSMAIGKELGIRVPLKKPSESIRRDALTEEQVWMMCCVALSEDKALDVLADPKKTLSICEEYANGGIGSLIQLNRTMTTSSKPYEDFLTEMLSKLPAGE